MFANQALAHMSMSDPPALRYKTNPHKTQEDYDYSSPLSPSGSNYPCKGYHKDLGTPGGASVASYSQGGSYSITLVGSATHAGGSCQISLSYDGGATFNVIKSLVGGCVNPEPGSSQNFPFTIPSGAPSGEALLAWSWFNNLGNREFYMNCAVVTIGGGRKHTKRAPSAMSSLEKRQSLGPQIFLANVGNGCTTASGKDVEFPDPGSDGYICSAAPAGRKAAVQGWGWVYVVLLGGLLWT
ncbi:putative endoglucanase [Geopyxis carbonaria]|nr:putative endoglucanase [Geopyxis carbonaria]